MDQSLRPNELVSRAFFGCDIPVPTMSLEHDPSGVSELLALPRRVTASFVLPIPVGMSRLGASERIMPKPKSVAFRMRIRVYANDRMLGPGKMELLARIDATGSLSAAAKQME